MSVKRIVANIGSNDMEAGRAFYGDLLGMSVIMDHGWIMTFGSGGTASPQLSIASEGGSGTAVPDLSIEVDNFSEVLAAVRDRKIDIEYGPVTESWGVTRFYVRDPFGRLINILTHQA